MNLCICPEYLLKINAKLMGEREELLENVSESISEVVSMVLRDDITITHKSLRDQSMFYSIQPQKSKKVQLIQLAYADIQTLITSRKQIEDFKNSSIIFNKFEYDILQNTWVVCILSESPIKVPLNICLNSLPDNEKFSIEYILYLIVRITELAFTVKNSVKYIGPILLENIYYRVRESVYSTQSFSTEILFDFFTADFLQQKNPDPDIYPESLGYSVKGFFWSLAIGIYRCLTRADCKDIPKFARISIGEIKEIIKKLEYIPSLTGFLISLFEGQVQDFESVLNSQLFQTWELVLGITHKKPEKLLPNAVLAMLFFSNQELCCKNLGHFSATKEFINEFNSESLQNSSMHKRVIEIIIKAQNFPLELFEFSLILINILKRRFRPLLKTLCLPLFDKIITQSTNLNSDSVKKNLITTLISIFDDCTLTIQMIFHHSGLIYDLCLKFPKDCNSLFPYVSYLGIKTLRFSRDLKQYNSQKKMANYMQKIPAHIKLQITDDIMEELEKLMSKKSPTLMPDSKKIQISAQVLSIIYELLSGIKIAKNANRLGMCYKNPQGYNTHPAMAECKACKIKICLVCGIGHQEMGHTVNFLTYSKLINWACEEQSGFPQVLHPSRNSLPRLDEVVIEEIENLDDWFTFSVKKLDLTGRQGCENLFYTEVTLGRCMSEEIIIELHGTGIVFINNKGLCKKNDIMVCAMPVIGENDTIGIGVTADCYAFFTYNGFIVSKFIEFNAEFLEILIKIQSPRRPILEANGKSLYNEEALDYLTKERLFQQKGIIFHLGILVQMKKKVLKQALHGKENLFSVVADLSQTISNSDLEAAVKAGKNSGIKRSDSNCTAF